MAIGTYRSEETKVVLSTKVVKQEGQPGYSIYVAPTMITIDYAINPWERVISKILHVEKASAGGTYSDMNEYVVHYIGEIQRPGDRITNNQNTGEVIIDGVEKSGTVNVEVALYASGSSMGAGTHNITRTVTAWLEITYEVAIEAPEWIMLDKKQTTLDDPIKLSWRASEGATEYMVQEQEQESENLWGEWQTIYAGSETETQVYASETQGMGKRFRVRARTEDATSDWRVMAGELKRVQQLEQEALDVTGPYIAVNIWRRVK